MVGVWYCTYIHTYTYMHGEKKNPPKSAPKRYWWSISSLSRYSSLLTRIKKGRKRGRGRGRGGGGQGSK